MKVRKVVRRLARMRQRPDVLNTIARDLAVALARGERQELSMVARELAAQAPAPDSASGADYWAGFAAGLGTLLAAYETAHEAEDARAACCRAVSSPQAKAVLLELSTGPATGAELARRLHITAGAASKILKSLRNAGLARILGGGSPGAEPSERGTPKPHGVTALGASIADEISAETSHEHPPHSVGVAAR